MSTREERAFRAVHRVMPLKVRHSDGSVQHVDADVTYKVRSRMRTAKRRGETFPARGVEECSECDGNGVCRFCVG